MSPALEASGLMEGSLPDRLPTSSRKLFEPFLFGDSIVRWSSAKSLVPAEYYTDSKRASEIKTPEHVQDIYNVLVEISVGKFILAYYAGKDDGPLKLASAYLYERGQTTQATKTVKGMAEWVKNIAS